MPNHASDRTSSPVAALLLATALAVASPALSAPPKLIAPADGAELLMAVPNFSWGQVFKPTPAAMPSYHIQIAADAAFSRIVDKDTLAAVITHYVPDKPLPPGRYHWRVAGVDAAGKRGPWSQGRSFTIRAPRAVRVPAGATFRQIRETIREAAAAGPARIVFDRATYRLDLDEPVQLFDLTDAADVTIDGNGSTVVFNRPAPVARFTTCRRILLRGFAFDYDPPTYIAGRVTAVSTKAATIDVEILPNHALPDSHVRFNEDRKGLIVTADEGCAIKRGVRLVYAHEGFERIAGRRFRFRFANGKRLAPLAPGDIYVLDPRWQKAGGGGTTVSVRGGGQVVLYDLMIFGGANECLNSFYADRHAILHVQLKRGPGRVLSVNNGGNNHHNARHGPWIEGCLFENCGDDVCHVNGYAMGIDTQPAPDRIRVRIATPYDQFCIEAALDFRVGDRLCFFHRRTGRLIGERRIKAVAKKGKCLDVTLDAPIEGITPGRLLPGKGATRAAMDNASVTHLFNASRTCNQFVFRNNTALNSRRVGVLAKGDGGLIEGNRFEGLGGGGVEFWNAPFEGLGAENYVVRNNRIVNCLRLSRTHAAIWCSAFKSGASRIHRNLLIEGNQITGPRGPAADIGDAAGVVWRNNQIVRPGGDNAPAEDLIRFRNVEGLVRQGTTIVAPKSP